MGPSAWEVHPVEAGELVFFYREVVVDLAELPDREALDARLVGPVVEGLLLGGG